MYTKRIVRHFGFYIGELFVLVGGFALLLTLNIHLVVELLILIFMLLLYVTLGIFHHRVDHDIKPKIVLEYLLISGIIVALFLFISTPRI